MIQSMRFLFRKDIERYYDTQQVFYTLLWSRTAVYYGLWYHDTKSLAQAILNSNNFVGITGFAGLIVSDCTISADFHS